MQFTQLFARVLGADRLAEAADEIAFACREAVSRRLALPLASMSPAEARGYIRARAIGPVTAAVERHVAQQPQLARRREALAQATMDAVIRLVLLRAAALRARPQLRVA